MCAGLGGGGGEGGRGRGGGRRGEGDLIDPPSPPRDVLRTCATIIDEWLCKAPNQH